jgi:hypothetical protein
MTVGGEEPRGTLVGSHALIANDADREGRVETPDA